MNVSSRAQPHGQGGAGGAPVGNQKAAKLADEMLPEVFACLKRIVTAEEPPRNARYAMEACAMVLEAAHVLEPEKPAASVVSMDAKRAAAILAARLKEREGQ